MGGVVGPGGVQRRVGLVAPSFVLAPSLLAQSELIALLPSRSVLVESDARLVALPPPVPIDGFALHLAWRARRDDDPVVRHVATAIQRLLV